MRRSRSGSFSSAREPGTRARVGEFWFYKEGKGVGVIQREGTRSFTSIGLGLVPGNVEGNLRLAHFTIQGCEGFQCQEVPRQGRAFVRRPKREGSGEGERSYSPSFYPTGVLMRIVTMYILFCIRCDDRGGHVPDMWGQCMSIVVCMYSDKYP